MYSDISEQFAEQVVATCRTAIGDDLRTVVYFTPDDYDVLYVREDLYDGDLERVREAKREIVENERLGFATSEMYDGYSENADPGLGGYEFTQRVFRNGFLTRILVDERGVLVTTDGFDQTAAREFVVSVRNLLVESERADARTVGN